MDELQDIIDDKFYKLNEAEQINLLRSHNFFNLSAEEKINFLERNGLFYLDINDDPPTIPLNPEKVDYTRNGFVGKFKSSFATSVAKRFVLNLVKKKQIIIKDIIGIENLNNLETGAIITCNHFNPYDSFALEIVYRMTKQSKKHRLFKVIREGNYTNFPGLYGFFFRNCNTLPLCENKKGMVKFMKAIDEIVTRGDFVFIYPEQSMWFNYKQPKPCKDGAFRFAAKNQVPILPVFITFNDSTIMDKDGNPIQEYTINIGKPITPNATLSMKENTKNMNITNYQFWKTTYEKFYNKPVEYTTKKDSNTPDYVLDVLKLQ